MQFGLHQAPRVERVIVLLPLLLLSLLSASPASGAWVMPVPHARLVGAFRLTPARPFAPGQRRGIDLRAGAGGPVRSACGGHVTYAGRTPGRDGLGITVRCGPYAATHLGLGSIAVRRGSIVLPGQRLGTVGATGIVRLGARIAARRRGYVDPLGLIGADPDPPPALVPVWAPRAGRSRPVAPPRVAPQPAGTVTGPEARSLSAVLWAGLLLLAVGLGVHVGVWRRRRPRRSAPVAAVEPVDL